MEFKRRGVMRPMRETKTIKLRYITIYDYRKGNEVTPIKREVEAWCAGGSSGIRAYFVEGGALFEVHGDDGHWWVVGTCDIHWLESIQEAVAAITANKEKEPTK